MHFFNENMVGIAIFPNIAFVFLYNCGVDINK